MAPPTPRLEALEDRLAPAVFGYPWPDATRLTVSFAPPSASPPAPGQPPAALPPPAGWQTDALRALQTWAAVANVNLVVVPDGGQPLGTPGLIQGDPRFGDVRIAWAALSTSSLSTSFPYSPLAGTWSGDVLINSSANFGPGGYDLYSVLLHEAGHVFGVPDEDADPGDVMFGYYNGVRAGLSAADVAAMQDLYGVRQADAFEGGRGDGSRARAADFQDAAAKTARTELRALGEDAGAMPAALRVVADVTTASDVDVYSYQTTKDAPGFVLRLSTRQRSLLSARVTVLDDAGRVVASAVADRNGDAVLRIDASRRQDLFFRVESADPAFSVGAYELDLTPDNPDALNVVQAVDHAAAMRPGNDSRATATPLQPLAQSVPPRLAFAADGRMSAGDVDYYRLRLPQGGSLDVRLNGAGPGMTVEVLDGCGRILAAGTTDASGGVGLRLDSVAAGLVYLRVSGGSGAYRLTALVDAPAETTTLATAGVLDSAQQQTTRGLELFQASLMHFELQVQTAGSVAAAVEATLFDEQGRIVFQGTIAAGQMLSVNLFLDAGKYTWRFVGGSADGSPLADTTFRLRQLRLNDPIGPSLIDPTLAPPPAVPLWLPEGFGTFVALTDPYGRPLSLITLPGG
jgi:hypothetical protein